MRSFTIIEYSHILKKATEVSGTFEEILERYHQTLIDGSKYVGKSKISTSPKTIKGLVSNLNKVQLNKAKIKGLPSKTYSLKPE